MPPPPPSPPPPSPPPPNHLTNIDTTIRATPTAVVVGVKFWAGLDQSNPNVNPIALTSIATEVCL